MKKLLIRDTNGNYGHAIEKTSGYKGNTYIEVRMFDTYEKTHSTNWCLFLIHYEVLDEITD